MDSKQSRLDKLLKEQKASSHAEKKRQKIIQKLQRELKTQKPQPAPKPPAKPQQAQKPPHEYKEGKEKEEKVQDWLVDTTLYTEEIPESATKAHKLGNISRAARRHYKHTHIANENGHIELEVDTYYGEHMEHYYLDTTHDIRSHYDLPTFIRVWNGDTHTPEFSVFLIYLYGEDNEKNENSFCEGYKGHLSGIISCPIYSVYKKLTYIRINNISRAEQNDIIVPITYFKKVNNGKGGIWKEMNDNKNNRIEKTIYHRYICPRYDYDEAKTSLQKLFLPDVQENCTYLQQHYMPEACHMTMIIEVFKESWDNHYSKKKKKESTSHL